MMNTFPSGIRMSFVMRSLALLLTVAAATLVYAQPRRLTVVRAHESEGRRLALVIGNSNYARLPLQNPLNDARAVAAELQSTGFEVTLETDLLRAQFLGAVGNFVQKVAPGDIVLFYYSGHGMAIDGINYLIPTELSARTEFEVKTNAIPLQMIREEIEKRRPQLRVLILDACRDNPFVFARSGAAGLARMSAAAGTIIAFAAEEGQTADDNKAESNGIFTKFLLEGLRTPGLKLRDLFDQVQRRVWDSTGGRQTPAIYSSVVPDFYFRAPLAEPAPPAPKPVPAPPPSAPVTDHRQETLTWEAVVIQNKRESYELYLNRYPNGLFSDIARERVKAMTQAAAPAPAPPAPVTAAAPKPAAELSITPEIPREYFRQFAQSRRLTMPPPSLRNATTSMTLVPWEHAAAFCEAVKGRLPSERELAAAPVPAGSTLFLWTSTEGVAFLSGQRKTFAKSGDAQVAFRCIIPTQ